jgi:hypothetical protein
MRFRLLLLICVLCGLTIAQPHLSPRYQTVFIVPMTNSLEQHLASRLTSTHALWVVLQPSNADVVLTDTIEEEFWTWLDRTWPPPAGAPAPPAAFRSASLTPGKHRGTIFLIDPHTRVVLWSIYDLPKNSSSAELDRSAARISNQLRVAFGRK